MVEKDVAALQPATVLTKLEQLGNSWCAPVNSGTILEPYPLDVAWQKLDYMVGLGEVKEGIAEFFDHVSRKRMTADTSKSNVAFEIPLNAFFGGNPGTGKTEVARLYGSLLRDAGVLTKGHVVMTSRADLVAQFVGHTGPKTRGIIDKAIGG